MRKFDEKIKMKNFCGNLNILYKNTKKIDTYNYS